MKIKLKDTNTIEVSDSKATISVLNADLHIESRWKKYTKSLLSKRVDGRELPLVHLIDMRREAQREKTIPVLSQPLVEALRQRYYDREQSILFLNRRGFNTTMICPDCGEVQKCKDCSISMTFHRTDGYLRCHICGYRKPAPRFCPSCRSFDILKKGPIPIKVYHRFASFWSDPV